MKKCVIWLMYDEGKISFCPMYERDIEPEQWAQISENKIDMRWSLAYYKEKDIPSDLVWIYDELTNGVGFDDNMENLSKLSFDRETIVRIQWLYYVI
jgi:hypothetical protein